MEHPIRTVIYAGLTGVAGSYIVHFLTHQRWWKEYRLRKLEELYVAVQNYHVSVAEYYTRSALYIRLPENTPDLPEQLKVLNERYLDDMQKEEKKAAVVPAIYQFYFGDLIGDWQGFLEIREALTKTNGRAFVPPSKEWDAIPADVKEKALVGISDEIIKVHLPALEGATNGIFKQLAFRAELIKSEKPWPVSQVVNAFWCFRQFLVIKVLKRKPK